MTLVSCADDPAAVFENTSACDLRHNFRAKTGPESGERIQIAAKARDPCKNSGKSRQDRMDTRDLAGLTPPATIVNIELRGGAAW
jgi:hypothetical protein